MKDHMKSSPEFKYRSISYQRSQWGGASPILGHIFCPYTLLERSRTSPVNKREGGWVFICCCFSGKASNTCRQGRLQPFPFLVHRPPSKQSVWLLHVNVVLSREKKNHVTHVMGHVTRGPILPLPHFHSGNDPASYARKSISYVDLSSCWC